MNTILNIIKINQGKYKFTVSFENDESKALEVPIDRLENSAEMVGIHFEIDGKRLEPVDFRIVSKEAYSNTIVTPGKHVSIEFIGTIEKRGEKHQYVSFKNASYQIIVGEKYKVWFSLNGYVSKPVEIVFALEQTS